jgi:hypothetical protein
MSGDKRLIVGGAEYVIDENRGEIDAIVRDIRQVLANGGLTEVPVLDVKGNPVTLLLGGHAGAVVLDLGPGPRPNELSP